MSMQQTAAVTVVRAVHIVNLLHTIIMCCACAWVRWLVIGIHIISYARSVAPSNAQNSNESD